MTRYILSIFCSILIALTCHGQEKQDTTLSKKSDKIIIKEMPDGTTLLELTDTDGDTTITKLNPVSNRTIIINSNRSEHVTNYTKTYSNSSQKWHFETGALNIGWNFAPGHGHSAPVEAGKSWEIGWFQIAGARYDFSRLTSVSIGIGMDWNNYKITTPDYYFSPNGNGGIETLPYTADVTPRYSRIKTFTLSLPLMIRQRMPFRLYGERQWIAVGASLGYSPHGSVLTRWTDESGRRVRVTDNKIGHRRWTCELIGILGVSSKVGVYVRYQPLSVLRGVGQPDFKSLSTGLILFY